MSSPIPEVGADTTSLLLSSAGVKGTGGAVGHFTKSPSFEYVHLAESYKVVAMNLTSKIGRPAKRQGARCIATTKSCNLVTPDM